MHSSTLSFFVFVALTSVAVLAQTTTPDTSSHTSTVVNSTVGNSTVGGPAILANCNEYNPDCSKKGVCQNDGTCRCFLGFYGTKGLGDCDAALVHPLLRVIRLFIGISYGLLLILMAYRLALEFFFATNEVGAAKWTARWNMFLILVYCIWMTVQTMDVAGVHGNMNPKAWWALYYFRDNLLLFIFAALLFHWADLYYSSIRKIRMANMLQKIKPDYDTSVTMDSVLLEISMLSKFRLAYVLVCLLTCAVYIGQNVNNAYSRDLHAYGIYMQFYQIFYMVIWTLFGVGYVYYGYKLTKILPPNSATRIITTMALMGVFAIFAIADSALNLEILFSLTDYDATATLAKLLGSYVLTWVTGFCAISVFMPFWQWNRWFNPRLIKHMWSDSNRTGSNGSQHSKENELKLNISGALTESTPQTSSDIATPV